LAGIEGLYAFKKPKEELKFYKFGALLRSPFVTYDFETKYHESIKEFVFLSYGFCFVNIFNQQNHYI
jgi:hypothetical protein